MLFWWGMLICDLLIPVVMIIAGLFMWKGCPKRINIWVGYRTPRSMKNMDTWKFAHDFCGRLWWKKGLILLVLSALTHILLYNSDKNNIEMAVAIIITIQCIVLIASIFLVESALKKRFNDDGTRK